MQTIEEHGAIALPRIVSADFALSEAIDAIGSSRFGSKILMYLYSVCGADYCAVFHLGHDSVSKLATGSWDGTDIAERKAMLYTTQHHWRNDPVMHQARDELTRSDFTIVHRNPCDLRDTDLRKVIYPTINDRVVVCGKRQEITLGLSVLRSDAHQRFSHEELVQLNKSAELLMSLLAKHASTLFSRPNVVRAITCLDEIQDCLSTLTAFPKREIEVCSRILHGLSSIAIALDLEVGEETVKTYRKRSYQRLGIGSERELLTWYLDLWSNWRGLSYMGPERLSGVQSDRPTLMADGRT